MILDKRYYIAGTFLGGLEMDMMFGVLHLVELEVRVILRQNGYRFVASGSHKWR